MRINKVVQKATYLVLQFVTWSGSGHTADTTVMETFFNEVLFKRGGKKGWSQSKQVKKDIN